MFENMSHNTRSGPLPEELDNKSNPRGLGRGALLARGQSADNDPQINNLNILTHSFTHAREIARKPFSDTFIDNALDIMSGKLRIGDETIYSIKSFLDQVPMTEPDIEIASSPEKIADLYRETSEMVQRNLKIMRSKNMDSSRLHGLVAAKSDYLEALKRQIPAASDAIVGWLRNSKKNHFPVSAVEYQGFSVDGKDILDSATRCPADFEPNFKIQRQLGGVFIMAFSNSRVVERKSVNRSEEPDRRIYLNPDLIAAPLIFEQILNMANSQNIKMQLKMAQRAPELASINKRSTNARDPRSTLRGDGIVIYVNNKYENQLLQEVMNIVEQNSESFSGRVVSRVAARIADGVGIGDEPIGVNGQESLTSHRAALIEKTLSVVRQSGLSGNKARDYFRKTWSEIARQNHTNPDCMAFNQ